MDGLPKKKAVFDDEDCRLRELSCDGLCGTRGGGALLLGEVGYPSILLSSVTGEKPLPGNGRLIVGRTPPLPSGTPLNSPPEEGGGGGGGG